jgi:GGDEF domain-containing protein
MDLDPYNFENSQRMNRLNGKIDSHRWQGLAARYRQFATQPASSATPQATIPVAPAAPATPAASEPEFARAASPFEPHAEGPNWPDMSSLSGVGETPASSKEDTHAESADLSGEGNVLEDLILQAEIFLQYGLKQRAVERLERVQKLFPGEELKNKKLRGMLLQAGFEVREAPVEAAPKPVAESLEEATVDITRVSEITRNIFRQGNVKNVLFAAVNDVGRTWKVSKCVAALCTPGKTPSALLEYCATGMKQSDALSLVRLVHGTMRLSADGSPLAVEDAESSTKLGPLAPLVKPLGIRSMLALPLMEGDQQMGVLVLEQCDARRHWRSNEVMVLKTIAEQMVMAASHVKLRSLMKSLSVTDERSGMLHRTSYIDCLISETTRSMKQGGSLCVSLVQFGKENQLVREVGEEPVRKFMEEIGQSITSHLRQNDVAIKYDSTTLAVVMPDTKGPEALQVMDKMRRLMGTVRLGEKASPPLTFGMVEPILDPNYDVIDSVTELINRAEDALAAAQKEGPGSGKLLSPEAS